MAGEQVRRLNRRVKTHDFCQELTSTLQDKMQDFVLVINQMEEEEGARFQQLSAAAAGLQQQLQCEVQERTDACAELSRELAGAKQAASQLKEEKSTLRMELAALKDRMDYLESSFGACADRQTRQVEALAASHAEAHQRHGEALEGLAGGARELGDAVERQAQALTAARAKLEKHAEVHGDLEGRLKEAADRCSTELEALRSEHTSLVSSVQQKHGELGSALAREAKAREALRSEHTSLVSSVQQKHGELGSALAREAKAREEREAQDAAVDDRFEHLVRSLGSSQDRHEDQARDLQAIREAHARHEEHTLTVRANLEGALGELTASTAHELQILRGDLDQVLGLLAGVQRAWRPGRRSKGPKTPKEHQSKEHQGKAEEAASPALDAKAHYRGS